MGPDKEKKGKPTKEDRPKNTGHLVKDARFEHMHYDPRFRRLAKKQTKVAIDPRFKGMLTDDRFKLNYSVDKYGRKIEQSTKDNLEKFYQLDEEEQGEGAKEGVETESKDSEEEGTGSDKDETEQSEGEEEEEEEEEEEDEDDENVEYDPSRGIGLVSSSDEEIDDEIGLDIEDEEEDEEEDLDRGDETARFAVQNMDWDNIGAADLMMVFNSFKPTSGTVLKVSVFPSEFGKKRMEDEDKYGPSVLRRNGAKEEEEEEDEEEEDDEIDSRRASYKPISHDQGLDFDPEALRKYQLERMRYFYAVVECDSVETASQIYKECDGQEYLNSGVLFDLRFIPDDMTFEDEAKEEINEIPTDYVPKEFVAAALQQSKVELTWDAPDKKRTDTLKKALSSNDIKDMDLQAYIASSSEEEDEEETKNKYARLLGDLKEEEDNEKPNQDMEITFEPGLKEKAEELLKQKAAKDAEGNMSVWEQYLEKKKQKRKDRKKALKNKSKEDQEEEDMDDREDLQDPYFTEDVYGSDFEDGGGKKTKGKKSAKTEEEIEQEEKEKAGLELLLMDDVDADMEKRHFNMKDIIKAETSKKKKKGKKGEPEPRVDNFKIDVGDQRFAALFERADYAVDPTDARFKKTNAMQNIMDERQRRGKAK
eukprot:Ihof_evm17s43 gene=Ihof_evmTU17s43